MDGRVAKRIRIEYDDGTHQILDKGLVCWFGGDGKTYAASYQLIGMSERDLPPLAFSIIELGEKLLPLPEPPEGDAS